MRLVEWRGKWAFRHEGRRISTGVNYGAENRDAAERAARRKIQELAPDQPEREIGAIMEAYAQDRERQNSDGSRVRTSWRALRPYFGGLSPDGVTRDLCNRYAHERTVSDGTILRDLKIMRAACSWFGPHTGQYSYPPEPEPRDRVLTKDEFKRLVDSTDTYHLKLFLHLAYGTAARAGAIYGLRWSRQADRNGYVDFSNNHINLGRKANGKKRAVVPMTKSLKKILTEAHKIRETDYVLEYAGNPIKSVRNAFSKACKRAKIQDFRIHDLRHTAAVHMLASGAPMEMVSQALGHSNMEITARVYARYRPEHLRRAFDGLEV